MLNSTWKAGIFLKKNPYKGTGLFTVVCNVSVQPDLDSNNAIFVFLDCLNAQVFFDGIQVVALSAFS